MAMAVLRKSDMGKLSTPLEVEKKIVELEKALFELSSEGNAAKAKPVRKAIARLRAMQSRVKRAPKK
jgi:ribosomal protein L29